MSSESDNEDFLSADEGGSDEEDDLVNEAIVNSEINANAATNTKEEPNLDKEEKESESVSDSTTKKQKKECQTAVKKKCKKELIDEPVEKDTVLDNKLQEEKIVFQEIAENIDQLTIEEPVQIAEEISLQKDSVEENIPKYDACEQKVTKNEEAPPQINVEQKKETCKKINEVKSISSTETETKNISPQAHSETKVKPIKESRIGMKKPRERLGERLGNKKLGSRITKPLVGISSDSLKQEEQIGCEKNDPPKSQKPQRTNDLQEENKERVSHSSVQHSDDQTIDEGSSWASWGDWGSTLITAASALTKEVSRGVGVVVDTVESGIGAPDPMELAKEQVEKEKMLKELSETEEKEHQDFKQEMGSTEDRKTFEPDYGFGFGTFGSLVSGVSGALETASNKVLLGGLDTLEKIGRKTMDIIQDGDPGLRRKRLFLNKNKENLSMVLREARERAIAVEEERSHGGGGKGARPNQVSMAPIWDNMEGPVHLEALSLVAKQCRGKTAVLLHDIPPVYAQELQGRIAKIKSMSSIEEDAKAEDIPSTLLHITRDVQLPLQFKNILTGWPSLQDALSKLSIEICGLGNADLSEVQMDLYRAVAAYVSHVVGICHKAAEMALTTSELEGVKLAEQFQRLCGCISGGLERSADDICESITKALPATDPMFTDTITNIYVQIAEANSYLETSLAHLNNVIIEAEVKLIFSEL